MSLGMIGGHSMHLSTNSASNENYRKPKKFSTKPPFLHLVTSQVSPPSSPAIPLLALYTVPSNYQANHSRKWSCRSDDTRCGSASLTVVERESIESSSASSPIKVYSYLPHDPSVKRLIVSALSLESDSETKVCRLTCYNELCFACWENTR